jgi:hypothetical protein
LGLGIIIKREKCLGVYARKEYRLWKGGEKYEKKLNVTRLGKGYRQDIKMA